MPTEQFFVRHIFAGGWATDFGPNFDASPSAGSETVAAIEIPFLINAENCIFELDGGPHKIPGTARLNSSAISANPIKGLFDYWISGTGGSSVQHRVLHIGTTIQKDDADGTFTSLFTGLTADAVPSYMVLEDLLILTNDVDTPKSWDGTTAQDLAGSPPNFSFAVSHKNRAWAAGVAADGSRLYYSVLLDPADWAGAGSGFIEIEPDDGDRITGIASHKNDLWIFKGPYKGSIHRITGSAPTGSDAFARIPFLEDGLGAVAHNTIFRFGSDLGFMWSDGTIHSLSATASFGDFEEAALSRQIHKWIREHVNFGRLAHASATQWAEFGVILFNVAVDGATDPNKILMMDFRFNPVRWGYWKDFDFSTFIASVVDPANNNRRIVMSGGNDGFVRKFGEANRSIDGLTAIGMKVTWPYLSYGIPIMMKTLVGGSIGFAPKNSGTVVFNWARDAKAQQTVTGGVAQGGGAVLGPASANQFTLGTSALAGALFQDRFFETPEGGEFRSIQFELINAVNNEDVELHSISAIIGRGAWSTEN